MSQWQAGLVFLLVVPVVFGLMWLGWRGRARRQGDVPEPARTPPGGAAGLGEPLLEPVDGLYVSTVRAGEWLDRVVVHGLGVRSRAVLHAGTQGVWFERQGAPDVFVPAADVLGARVESGIAGKYTVGEGLLVVRWRLAGGPADPADPAGAADADAPPVELDTGFRPRRWAEAPLLAAALQPLVPGGDQ
ncbi:PH-like domain-containing protein [Aquipuribacter sp. SD81]|uniref:PH-like domain-containing protein n=1 Tax=Aquipuribacter sp. SD81 TaxID=3127703 RepID=UPI00301B156D